MFLPDSPDTTSSVRLVDLKTGAAAILLSMNEATPAERHKLMALGLLPGARLRILQRLPSYVVAVGYTQVALDRETARLLHVRPLE